MANYTVTQLASLTNVLTTQEGRATVLADRALEAVWNLMYVRQGMLDLSLNVSTLENQVNMTVDFYRDIKDNLTAATLYWQEEWDTNASLSQETEHAFIVMADAQGENKKSSEAMSIIMSTSIFSHGIILHSQGG